MIESSKVVALCGCARFRKEFLEVNQELALEKSIVITLWIHEDYDDNDLKKTSTKINTKIDDIEKRIIDTADEVYVLDVNNSIVEKAHDLIDYSNKQKKTIKYYSKEKRVKKYSFEKLSPTIDADINSYEEALDFVFDKKNHDIQNIALTGVYGSGKSSVINSYERIHKMNFIHVSLAHFDGVDEESPDILEKKIINHIIQQVPADLIPDTQFKLKKEFSRTDALLDAFVVAGLIFCSLYILKYDYIKDVLQFSSTTGYMPLSILLAIILLFFGFAFLIFKSIQWNKRSHVISKIAIKGNELELDDCNDDKSYFNRHVDEILYVLEKITAVNNDLRCDAIVIEDLDRLDNNVDSRLFEKIRELCILANERIAKKNGKKYPSLKFIYLLSDKTFISKERTKFFDFIIPIIPVVDSLNAYAKLKEGLNGIGYLDKIDDNFLRDLSLYFDDYRIIKNIINEFQIYVNKLTKTKHNYNELLAIIVYKNYFPQDFASLQIRTGYVNSVFELHSTLVKNEISAIETSINNKKERLKNIGKEQLSNEAELEAVRSDRQNRSYQKIYTDLPFTEWEKKEYPKRKQAIIDIANHEEENLRREIIDQQNQIPYIRSKKLCKLIDERNAKKVFDLTLENPYFEMDDEHRKVFDDKYFIILKYLIISGYLDDSSYRDYMACFDEEDMTISDKDFLISVHERNEQEFGYKIDNCKLMYERLKDDLFLLPSVRNFNLIDYILSEKKEGALHLFVNQLRDNADVEFIAQFLRQTTHYDEFILQVCMYWDDFLDSVICEDVLLSFEEKQRVVFTALSICSNDIITRQNGTGSLVEYLTDSISKASCSKEKVEAIVEKLAFLGIEIQDLDSQIDDNDLRSALIDNSLYAINYYNLKSILQSDLLCNQEAIENRFLSSLIDGENESISQHIQSNLAETVAALVKNCKTQADTLEVIVFVSQCIEDEDLGSAYMNISTTEIDDINNINPKYWHIFAEKHTMKENTNNVMSYFKFFHIDIAMSNYLSSLHDMKNIDFVAVSEKNSTFWDEVCCNDDLSDSVYDLMVQQVGKPIQNFTTLRLSDSKMKSLISSKLIPVNNASISFIRKNYLTLVFDLVSSDSEKYIRCARGGLSSISEVMQLAEQNQLMDESNRLEDDFLIELLDVTNEKISIKDKQVSDRVLENIITKHFVDSDLEYLACNYDSYSDYSQEVIYRAVCLNIKLFSLVAENSSQRLLARFFGNLQIPFENKLEILNKLLQKNVEHGRIANILQEMGEESISKLFLDDGPKTITVNNTEIRQNILNVLKENGIVKDFKLSEDGKIRIKNTRYQ